MGFALFDKSGTWDPAAAGLKVGDQVYVVCVGGGGAGYAITNNSSAYYGGNGGSSNFGSYVTSLGGYGGAVNTSLNPRWKSTPTSYMNKGGYSNNNNLTGGMGAGGWYFEYPNYTYSGSYTNGVTTANRTVSIPAHHGLGGYLYIRDAGSNTQYTISHVELDSSSTCWAPKPTIASGYVLSCGYAPLIPVGAGPAYGLLSGNHILNQYYPATSETNPYDCFRSSNYGSGGLGYGAGGGSYGVSAGYAYTGGCSGEIKREMVTLTSVSSITIGVGGGGSPAYTYASSYYNGVDGSTGAGAIPTDGGTGIYIQRGGYGTGFPPDGTTAWTSSSWIYTGGAGAGGCVAIWW